MIVKRRSASRRSFIELLSAFPFQPIHGPGKDEIKRKGGKRERRVGNRRRTKKHISLRGHRNDAEDKHAIAANAIFGFCHPEIQRDSPEQKRDLKNESGAGIIQSPRPTL